MKQGELTAGQTEALLKKLGGLEVVHAILAGSDKLLPYGVENRKRIAFLQSFEQCVAIRDMLRGWGDYTHGADEISIYRIADTVGNLAEAAIKGNTEINEKFKLGMIGEIEMLRRKLVEFKVRDGEGFDYADGCLEEIKQSLISGDRLAVFKHAHSLKSFLQGMETMNGLILNRVDEVEA